MRKLRRNKNKIFRNVFIVIIVLLVITFSKTGYSFFIQTLNISGKANIGNSISVNNDSTCNTSVDITNSYWATGNNKNFTYNFNLKNLSNKPYYGWNVSLSVPSDATVTTVNCTYSITNGILSLKNTTYNSYLESNQTVSFSATISTKQSYALRTINVYNCKQEGNISNDVTLKVELVKTGGWGNVEQYDVSVINESNTAITAWKIVMEFDASLSITSSWNVNHSRLNNTVTFTNMSYNGALSPSGRTTFGIQVSSKKKIFAMTVTSAIGSI